MKKLLITIMLVSAVPVFAQDDKPDKIYHNEFGIDATAFFMQFLNLNLQNPTATGYYFPTYYITYRRYTHSGNVRFAIGGDYNYDEKTSGLTDDSHVYKLQQHSYDILVGWEFKTELSKRWQVYYGMDFRPSYSSNKDDLQYSSNGYAQGTKTKSKVYGVAPLLGVRFKLSKRLSILTETSYSFNWETDYSKKYYTPIKATTPAKADEIDPKLKSVFGQYSQPISVFFTFSI